MDVVSKVAVVLLQFYKLANKQSDHLRPIFLHKVLNGNTAWKSYLKC